MVGWIVFQHEHILVVVWDPRIARRPEMKANARLHRQRRSGIAARLLKGIERHFTAKVAKVAKVAEECEGRHQARKGGKNGFRS